jgi:hypothetical protein
MNSHTRITISIILAALFAVVMFPLAFPELCGPHEEKVAAHFDVNDPKLPPAWRAYMNAEDD